MSKELGQVLKILRNNCSLTQQQVADVLHLDRSTYAYYERGTTEPDLKSIRKLAVIFGVDPAVLLPDADGMPYVSLDDADVIPHEEGVSTELVDPKTASIYQIPKDEQNILIAYRILTEEKKEALRSFLQELSK